MPFFRLFFLTCSSARTHRCVCVWLWLLPGFLGLSVCVCGCVCVCVWVCRAEGTTEPGRPKSFSRALKRAASSRVLSRVLRTTPKKKPNKNKRNTPQRPNRLCVGVCVGLCVCVFVFASVREIFNTTAPVSPFFSVFFCHGIYFARHRSAPRRKHWFFPFFLLVPFFLAGLAKRSAATAGSSSWLCHKKKFIKKNRQSMRAQNGLRWNPTTKKKRTPSQSPKK